MSIDPVASIAPSAVVVTLGKRTYRIPPHPAAVWLALLLTRDLEGVLPGLLTDDDAEDLDEALWSGEVGIDQVRDAIFDMITVASGRNWWWAFNLLAVCAPSWSQKFGTIMLHGFDIHKESIAAFLDVLYSLCVDGSSEEQRRSFDSSLDQAPVGYQEIDEETEAATFLAMLNGQIK